MSKKQRTAEQSRLTNICSLCQDKHKDALMCTCEKWFCADCLQNETNEWPQNQDETSLVSRVSVCTHCGLSTLCSLCAIAAFYQGCTTCRGEKSTCSKYLNVCPQCVFKQEALSLIPDNDTFYPIMASEYITKSRSAIGPGRDSEGQIKQTLYSLIQEGDEISTVHITSACSSSTSLSKMTWYCLAHRPTQETTPYWSVVRSATLTPESSDYESEVFDVGCSDEDFPDWSEFCVIPNISLSQGSPSSSPAY